MYVTESAIAFPPTVCVVTALNVPQEVPLHPAPLSDQAIVVLGADPGTAVSVATSAAEAPAGTPDGAESCRENVLVIVTAAEICFEGSATLCAVSVTPGAAGRMAGAV